MLLAEIYFHTVLFALNEKLKAAPCIDKQITGESCCVPDRIENWKFHFPKKQHFVNTTQDSLLMFIFSFFNQLLLFHQMTFANVERKVQGWFQDFKGISWNSRTPKCPSDVTQPTEMNPNKLYLIEKPKYKKNIN